MDIGELIAIGIALAVAAGGFMSARSEKGKNIAESAATAVQHLIDPLNQRIGNQDKLIDRLTKCLATHGIDVDECP